MESLMGDCLQFSSAIAKFSFLEGRLSTMPSMPNFEILFNFPHF